jgi:UPF0176 protein
MFEAGENMVLVDMRNDYEYKVGRFKDAIQPKTDKFYELPEKVKNLKIPEGAKAVTYCTGGIRCEKASGLLLKHGFTNVRQLEGGIVRYCEAYPNGYYDGSLFVFDKRMTMRFPGVRKPTYVSHCMYCSEPCDRCVNCSDPRCHSLIICCEQCSKEHEGLCRELATRRS